jgi:hypothetical protein
MEFWPIKKIENYKIIVKSVIREWRKMPRNNYGFAFALMKIIDSLGSMC